MKNFIIVLLLGILFLSCNKSGDVTKNDTDSTSVEEGFPGYEPTFDTVSVIDNSGMRIHFEDDGGVKLVPVEVNGVTLKFVLDTGAAITNISLSEALYLYTKGKITEDDILSPVAVQTADGAISVNQVINLRELRLGSKTIYDVEATVVNDFGAPLLLGQNVLQEFGKFTIDNNLNEVVFQDE